jgi:hypothetical protein
MMVFLGWRILICGRTGFDLAHQTVNTLAQPQQVRCTSDSRAWCLRTLWCRAKVGPGRGNVRSAAVRQDEEKMRFSFMPQLSEHFEHLTFEGVVRAYHPDLGWEVSEVGSVS